MTNAKVHEHKCENCGEWFECPQDSRKSLCAKCLGERMYNRSRIGEKQSSKD